MRIRRRKRQQRSRQPRRQLQEIALGAIATQCDRNGLLQKSLTHLCPYRPGLEVWNRCTPCRDSRHPITARRHDSVNHARGGNIILVNQSIKQLHRKLDLRVRLDFRLDWSLETNTARWTEKRTADLRLCGLWTLGIQPLLGKVDMLRVRGNNGLPCTFWLDLGLPGQWNDRRYVRTMTDDMPIWVR